MTFLLKSGPVVSIPMWLSWNIPGGPRLVAEDKRRRTIDSFKGRVVMMDEIIDQLRHMIVEGLDVNIHLNEIDADASLFEDGLGLDSVILVEFISLIEEQYGFQFSDEELNMELFGNLRKLAEFIRVKTDTKQAGMSPQRGH
jgi:acyl carrier protein